MASTFFLVRHAIKEKAVGDVSITANGIKQAKATAKYFCGMQIEIIATSPLRRAKETAQFIARKTKSAMKEDIHLRERANWGDLPGQTFDEFVAMWDRSTRDPDYIPPVGDSAKSAGERLYNFLIELGRDHPPESNFVVVTHGGLITDFLVYTFTESDLTVWHPNFIEVQSSLIPECSITKLNYDKGSFKIEFFASVEHLSSAET